MKAKDRIHSAKIIRNGWTTIGVPARYRASVAHELYTIAHQKWPNLEHGTSTWSEPSLEYFNEFVQALGAEKIKVHAFLLDQFPVSISEFSSFWTWVVSSDYFNVSLKDRMFWKSYFLENQARGDEPITSVSWHEANLFCAVHGGRLPTTIEYHRAVRRGDECPDLQIVYSNRKTNPSGVAREFQSLLDLDRHRSWSDCYDILENADEWTSSYPVDTCRIDAQRLCVFENPFPLLELSTGQRLPWIGKNRDFQFARYIGTGFRCAYPFR